MLGYRSFFTVTAVRDGGDFVPLSSGRSTRGYGTNAWTPISCCQRALSRSTLV